ncbi:MAG: lipopolysaccharide heptosyltransferase II, partial [Candidatus Omnitrophica bacterium CG1_02_49_10]
HGYYSKHLFSRVMGWGRTVIVLSNAIGNHMIRDFNVDPSKIRIIHRGVDLERFHYKERAFGRSKEVRIGIVGRMTPLKGHDDFLRAISRVVRVIPNAKAVIAGDAPSGKEEYRHQLEMLTRRLGLTKYVQFLGARDDMPELFAGLDILVLATNREEGFGRVIIEAAASGVPVVATEVGGVKDIIEDRHNGLLIPPREPIKMAEAIIELIKDRELSESLSRNGRRAAEEKFSLDDMAKKTLKVYEEAVSQKRILIVKFGAIGDTILAVPSLRAVRKKFPKAFIAVLTAKASAEVLQRCPYIDEIILFERGAARPFRIYAALRKLMRYDFDISIDLQNNFDSHVLAFMAGISKRVGYDRGKTSVLLSDRARDPGIPITPVAHQFHLLSLLGIEERDQRLELWLSDEDNESVNKFLKDNWVDEAQPIIGISPVASSRWKTKRWPPEKFAALSEMISRELHMRTVITGGASDAKVIEDSFDFTDGNLINACGRTSLMELACLIKRCSVFITGDSASLHIASGVGAPFVALFGPTDPARHLPPSDKFILLYKKVKCSPCYKSECRDIRCMKHIKTEDVFDAVRELLYARKEK